MPGSPFAPIVRLADLQMIQAAFWGLRYGIFDQYSVIFLQGHGHAPFLLTQQRFVDY